MENFSNGTSSKNYTHRDRNCRFANRLLPHNTPVTVTGNHLSLSPPPLTLFLGATEVEQTQEVWWWRRVWW